MDEQLNCPRCGGDLEPGHMLDHTHGGVAPAQWQPGGPVRSFWTGLKVNRKEVLPVTTYRCVDCGYLEMYALPQAKDRG